MQTLVICANICNFTLLVMEVCNNHRLKAYPVHIRIRFLHWIYSEGSQKVSKMVVVFWMLPLEENLVPNHFNYEEYIIYIVHY